MKSFFVFDIQIHTVSNSYKQHQLFGLVKANEWSSEVDSDICYDYCSATITFLSLP